MPPELPDTGIALISAVPPELGPGLNPKQIKQPNIELKHLQSSEGVRYVVSWVVDDSDSKTLTVLKNFESDTPFDGLKVTADVDLEEPSDSDKSSSILRVVVPVVAFHLSAQQTSTLPMGNPAHPVVPPGTTLSDIAIREIKPTQIEIHSKLLVRLLDETVPYYPDQALSGDCITIEEPYPVLLHYIDELQAFYDVLSTKEPLHTHPVRAEIAEKQRHLRILLDFIQPTIRDKLVPIRSKLQQDKPVITFSTLWYLFKPGTEIYVERTFESVSVVLMAIVLALHEESDDEYHARTHTWPRPWTEVKRSARVEYFVMESDGRKVGRVANPNIHQSLVVPFQGEKEVTALPAYPCEYWDRKDDGKRRATILERGRQCFSLVRKAPAYMKLTGTAFSTKRARYIDTAVVVDVVSAIPVLTATKEDEADPEYTFLNPAMTSKDDPWASYNEIDVKDSGKLRDDQYMLLLPYIPCFILKEKKWVFVNAVDLRECDAEADALNDLVIGDTDATFLKALFRDMNVLWKSDYIEQKGEGSTILLHGPPGVGKTYSVECLTRAYNRPLLMLTVADVGLEEDKIDSNLSTWFHLAEMWKAVLLIDEADVFLERRTVQDIKRNGLVSVFLRRLEYFKGLVFLTTNRTGQIDDAFVSRLTLVIGYDRLNQTKRADIWRNFFAKLKKDMEERSKDPDSTDPIIEINTYAEDYVLEDKEVEELDWNGREIRNALQTAISLARYQSRDEDSKIVRVRPQHFKEVVQMSRSFQKYMKKATGQTEQARAIARRDRNDNAVRG